MADGVRAASYPTFAPGRRRAWGADGRAAERTAALHWTHLDAACPGRGTGRKCGCWQENWEPALCLLQKAGAGVDEDWDWDGDGG